jgi:ABC-type multidrug transport system fused ATPase/permease subunit
VIVAHRLSTIQDADVVIAMDGGTIVGSGSFKELRASSPLVRKYVSLMTIK